MKCYYILGLRINHRHANAAKLQETLTSFGCNIRMRVGLHETDETFCSDDGVIVLQVCGDEGVLEGMVATLSGLDGITVKVMDLN